MRGEAGLTLLETVVSTTILLLFAAAAGLTWTHLERGSRLVSERAMVQEEAALALQRLVEGRTLPGLRAARQVEVKAGGSDLEFLVRTEGGSQSVRYRWEGGRLLCREGPSAEEKVVLAGVSDFTVEAAALPGAGTVYYLRLSLASQPGVLYQTAVWPRNARGQ